MQLRHISIGALATFILATVPTIATAQGSATSSSGRLIDFDRARAVCVSSGADLRDAPGGNVIETLGSATSLNAVAITLDQNWIAVQNGDAIQLVSRRLVAFTPC